jgi:hypothetical protein
VIVLALFACAVPSALAAPSPTQTAQHDPSVETVSRADASPNGDAPQGATPEESVRNQWGPEPDGPDPGTAPDHPDNRDSIETFRFNVAEGEENSGFTLKVGWGNPDIDFDIFVYRIRDNGTLDPDYIASAATADDPEIIEYSSNTPGEPVRQDEYIVAVHNYCSSNDDPPATCDYLDDTEPGADEDFWEAEVTFTAFDPSNVRPSVSLAGPTTATTGQSLSYTAEASDPDGEIDNVAFDLDGDGRHETDTAGGRTASTSFSRPGLYSVGVRVIDNEGAPAYDSVDVRVSGPPAPGSQAGGGPATTGSPATTASSAKRRLLGSFKLNRPVFGGRKGRSLVIRYRLREAGRVILSLYRGKKRISRLSAGNRRANRAYRIKVSPRRLRKGANYRVRIFVRSADGKQVQRARLAAKRL